MNSTKPFSGRIIYDHLPKTAGQSINSWLTETLGTAIVKHSVIGTHDVLKRIYCGDYSILSGHLWFYGQPLDDKYDYVTICREPLDRVLSWIFFNLNNHGKEENLVLRNPLTSFLKSKGDDFDPTNLYELSNYYVNHFASIDGPMPESDKEKIEKALDIIHRYTVWGLCERMDEFLFSFSALLNIAPPEQLPKINLTKKRPTQQSLSPKFISKLKELNELDIIFYNKLKKSYYSNKALNHESTIINWKKCDIKRPDEENSSNIEVENVYINNGEYHTFHDQIEVIASLKLNNIASFSVEVIFYDELLRIALGVYSQGYSNKIFQASSDKNEVRFTSGPGFPAGKYTGCLIIHGYNHDGFEEKRRYEDAFSFRITDAVQKGKIGYLDVPFSFDMLD